MTLLITRRPTCEGSSFPSSENSDLLDDWSLPGFLYKIWALISTSLRFGGPWTFRRFPALFGTSKVTIRTRPHTHEYPWTYKGTFKTVHCLGWGRFAQKPADPPNLGGREGPEFTETPPIPGPPAACCLYASSFKSRFQQPMLREAPRITGNNPRLLTPFYEA